MKRNRKHLTTSFELELNGKPVASEDRVNVAYSTFDRLYPQYHKLGKFTLWQVQRDKEGKIDNRLLLKGNVLS